MNPLITQQARILREAMDNAHQTFSRAQADYQHALGIAIDTGANADGAVALRREGRAYAQAFRRYSEATMAWLAYVDTQSP